MAGKHKAANNPKPLRKIVSVRLNDQQYAKIEAAAKKNNMSVGCFMRLASLGKLKIK